MQGVSLSRRFIPPTVSLMAQLAVPAVSNAATKIQLSRYVFAVVRYLHGADVLTRQRAAAPHPEHELTNT